MDKTLRQSNGVAPKGIKNLNIAQFLAEKEDISDALSKGWSVKAIWEVLHEEGRFSGGYNCFTVYIKKYIKQSESPISSPMPCITPAQDQKEESVQQPQSKSFSHNPVAPDLKSFV